MRSPGEPLPAPSPARCWCGEPGLLPWGSGYLRCPRCATLVVASAPGPEVARVDDEARSPYGLHYFDEHARELGHPTLRERARSDLPERCAFWAEALLRFRPPPARTLELGCASGAFVALLAEAGYQATGLDLSPAVTAFARETFQVPVLTGPLETQALPPGSVDVAILMDVLEHLPDPLGTLQALERLLAPDGLLLVQTPRFDPSRSPEALRAQDDAFLAQLKPAEHLFLLSPDAAGALLSRAGLPHVRFLPAIFSAYDMCLVAAREPPRELLPEAGREALRRTRGGRVVEAVLDAAESRRAADEARRQAEGALRAAADRAAALEREGRQAAEERARLRDEAAASAARISALEARLAGLREVEAEHLELLRRMGVLARLFGAAPPRSAP